MIVVDRFDDDALKQEPACQPEQCRCTDGGEQSQEVKRQRIGAYPRSKCREHGCSDEGTEGDEGRVAEVENVHQPENEAQSRGHEKDHHAHGKPRHGERHPGGEIADKRQRDDHQQDG